MNPFDQFDEATTGNPFDQFDTPAPAAGIQAKDLAVSLKQGVQRLPSMLAGLADIPLAVAGLNRPMSRLADLAGEVTGFQPEKWAKEADAQHSPGYHAQQAALGNAWKDSGVDDLSRTLFSPEEWDKLGQKWDALDGKSLAKEIVQNPGAVGSMAVESLPGMLTGGLIGKGVKTAAGLAGLEGLAGSSIGAAATRAGIGEGSVTAGQVMSQIDPSVDPLTAAGAATGAGVVTGLVGGTSGRIAAKLGLPDLEMAMAGAKGGSLLSLLQRLPASMAQEGLLEEMPQSMQEQVWQNAAEGKPLGEGVLRRGVDGMLAGMTTGGVFSALPQRAPAGPPPGPLTQAASLAPRVPEPTAPDPGAIDLSAMADAAGVMPAGSAGAPPGQGVERATSIAPGAPAIWRYDNVDHPVEVVAVMPHQGMDGRQYVKVQGVVNGTQQTDVVPIDELVTAGQQDQVPSGAAPGLTVAPSSPEATIPQPGVPEASGLSAPDTGSMPQRPAGPGVNLDALFVEQTPVPLKNAHRIVRMYRSQGSEHAVIPSPTGKGFGVAPLADLSQAQLNAFGKFQPKGSVAGGVVTTAPRLPADLATPELMHVEGRQAESVTAPVVGQSLAQTGKAPASARAWLVTKIDKALASTGDQTAITEYADLMARVDDARRVAALKKTEPAKATMLTNWANKTEAEALPALRSRIGYVTFDVPGDGKFKVLNTPEHLEQFRTRVRGSKGFAGVPAPVEVSVDAAASQANTAPSEKQKEAGNYTKGHITVGGLKVAIENPAGSSRSGVEGGKAWTTKMQAHYGYLKRTTGADGDQVDVYVKPGTQPQHDGPVFVVDQYDPATGTFDEHKVLMGYGSQAEAAKAYDAHFGDRSGPKRRGSVSRLSLDEFKGWLASGDTKKPLSSKKVPGAQNEAPRATPQPEADPYAQLDTRPNTADRQRATGRNALRDLLRRVEARVVSRRLGGEVRPAVTLLGAGLYKGFTQSGGVDLTGQRVETPADLAALAQVFRDPRFETFRVFYTDGNVVVGQAGYSSRLPAAVFIPNNLADQIAKDKNAFGADGFWILHNHPSGESRPSPSDMKLTTWVAGEVLGFLGHVVIDHNEYSTIDANGEMATIKAPELAGIDFHSNPELEHELLGVKINGPREVTQVAKALQIEGGHATVVLTRRHGQVQLLADMPAAALQEATFAGRQALRAALRRLARAVGAGGNRFVVVPAGAEFESMSHLVTTGLFTDVVSADGRSMRDEGTFFPGDFLDNKTKDAMRVAEGDPPAVETVAPPRATLRDWIKHQVKQHRGWAMGALTRDQLADIYGRTLPQVNQFDRVVQKMDVTRNQIAETADALVERWRKLPGAMSDRLADLMHVATLAQFDPDQTGPAGPEQIQITRDWQALSPDARALYREVRDQYRATLLQIRNGLAARAERAGEGGVRIATEIRLQFDRYLAQGPYFSLARFGDFVLISDRGEERIVEAFESSLKREMRQRALKLQGWTTKATARQTYSSTRDGAAGKFVGDVLERIAGLDMNPQEKADLMDGLNQLAISVLPDASYRKHFSHRKGTPGFSNDAMRAFASAQQHAAHHIARINHADELTTLLEDMQAYIRGAGGDMTERQQVVNELTRRLDMLLKPTTHPVTAALGQVGFVMSLGGSLASGITNLTQTPLVTFPFLGARFGFDKASAALTKASTDYFGGRWDKWSGFVMQDNPQLAPDEQDALRELEKAGLINLTQAHDLAGAANTDSTHSARAFAINRAMKIVGWTFHLPEVFNRQVSALAAYRLARNAGHDPAEAIESARQALIRTHFDYSASNRARLMAGNVTRVLTMFKQYSQNVTYLLWRNAHQALQGETPAVRREARRMLLGVASMHFAAAGAMGLPLGVFGVSPLLAILAAGMGDDDEPWDWETEFRNMLADTVGTDLGEAIAHGPLRLISNVDFASRVGLGDLWIRAPQKDAEGRDLVEAWMLTLLGPVAGYAANVGTAVKAFDEGKFSRGVEALMPKMLSAPIKALRYEREGVRSWTGDDLGVELSGADLLGAAAGFQPSRLAEMYEARAAVKGREAQLQRRREELINEWVSAQLSSDPEGMREAMADAWQFSRTNREFAITPDTFQKAMQAKRRAQQQIQQGVYLSRKHEGLREEGRFANLR